MNKILTISIAAYNVENLIKNTLDSLLIDEIDKLEILVEDDGGTDSTAKIAKEYEELYPNSIKLVHKKNGGYGSTINNSIQLATGKYFKQLDGDDWFDKENLSFLISILEKIDVDVIYTPFIKVCKGKEEYINDSFPNSFEGLYNIEDIIGFCLSDLLMHNLSYKTSLLKKNKIHITEHCFYTDNEYALYPFAYAKTIYILHIPIYYYRIGRNEQSVSIRSRGKNYQQHIKISDIILKNYTLFENVGDNTKNYIYNRISKMLAGGIAKNLMISKFSISVYKQIKKRDMFIKDNYYYFYKKMGEISKIIKLLRFSHYFLYFPLYFFEIAQLKRENY